MVGELLAFLILAVDAGLLYATRGLWSTLRHRLPARRPAAGPPPGRPLVVSILVAPEVLPALLAGVPASHVRLVPGHDGTYTGAYDLEVTSWD